MNHRIVIAAACLVVLAGCGDASDKAGATPPPQPTGATAPVNKTTVAAVREGSGNAAVRVRFLLEKPPVVGQEVQLHLDFSSFISEPSLENMSRIDSGCLAISASR